ncbi:hypothetical protein GAP32_051 [Cronobacter phage vB_CsaM_GAP32]|uniref:Uncharacterized protein n=1 Tax=Cronobacter phage vB_CsaM_GAP32 TaxID=1141136 RepID=K4FB04_9CAUD|nr:hypothetical protein GAP32_051 [Cronobacter phage vB_CsaM_GAP32]AFC21499.1 hypothetical protein GAP32_051 [Cronobacter phage vB_CsaM_GAP32]
MGYTIQKYEYFKEVLAMIGTFEQGLFGDLEYNDHDVVRLRLVRARDDRMTFNAYVIGHDYDYNIFSSTWLYRDCLTNFTNYSITQREVLSTTYYQYRDNEFIVKSQDGLFDSKVSTLQYPIQEDEYFQQLTRIDLPPEDEIERFMTVSKEIISRYPEFVGFTFHGGTMMQEINETNHENMVQSVMDCMNELVKLEMERKNGGILE